MKKPEEVKWMIEDFSMENATTELGNAAMELDYEVKWCNKDNLFNQSWDEYFGDDECVVTQTSIQTAHSIMREKPNWIPGPWFKQEFFQCKYYYQFFGEYLFNDKYIMLPLGEVPRRLDDLYNWLGVDDCIFIRPSTGCKTFTGQVFERDRFEHDWNACITYGGSPTDLVVISTPKNIRGEYRYIIGDNKIIASSEYSWDKKKSYKEAPKYIDEYVNMVLNDTVYDPDPVWVLDIALDNDLEPHVLEVGSFSSSGLYACDKKKIVTEVSKIAAREFNEFSPTLRLTHENSVVESST